MPDYTLAIGPEWEGRTVRGAALSILSSGQFKRAKFEGMITLDGVPVHADARLRAGQTLRLFIPEPERDAPVPVSMKLRVPYEDALFWMIDKPAPLPTACSARQDGPTLENGVYALAGCPRPFVYRPVNRLDKGTSGLLLVAKTAQAQYLLQRLLHTEDFVREYLAVVDGEPPAAEGVIDLPIGKAEGATIRREVRADGREARTHYRVLQAGGGRSLLRLRLYTGRTHQIRVHLSALGCPVTGDFLYGAERPDLLPGRFALHSALIRLRHPQTGLWLERESPLPPALRALL